MKRTWSPTSSATGSRDSAPRSTPSPSVFSDAEAFADLFITYYGPTHTAAAKLDDAGRSAFRADLVAHANAFARPGVIGLECDWEYRIVQATRR